MLRLAHIPAPKLLAVQLQHNHGRVGTDPHVYNLARAPIPMGVQVHHGVFSVISPGRLIYIIGIFGKASGVQLAEEGVFTVVGSGLTNVVKAGPDELAQRKGSFPLRVQAGLGALRTPAHGTVTQSRALTVILTQDGGFQGKVVDAPALHHGAGFTTVDCPVRILLPMRPVQIGSVIVPHSVQKLSADLGVFPLQVVGSKGDQPIAAGIMPAHQVHEEFGQLETPLPQVGI